MENTFLLNYDKLIVATGSTVDTFNIPGVQNYCYFLKELQDSRKIRNRIIDCFENASILQSNNESEDKIKNLLHFCVVGGGPYSVLFVHQLTDLKHDLKQLYPNLVKKLKVTFIELNNSSFNTYDLKISNYFDKFNHNGHNHDFILLKSKINKITKDEIILEEEEGNKNRNLKYGACFWLTGPSPSSIVNLISSFKPEKQNNKHALITNGYLQVKGFSNIYAIGESSTIDQEKLFHRWILLFNNSDEDNDGFLNKIEFSNFIKNNSRHFPQLIEFGKQTEKLFEQTDLNKDGKISKEEFQELLKIVDLKITSFPTTAQTAFQQGKYLSNSLNNILNKNDIINLFNELDSDKNGKLDKQEIKIGLKKLGLINSNKNLEKILEISDKNNDGKLDKTEFVNFVLQQQFSYSSKDWKKLSHSKILPFRYKHLGGFEYVGYENNITIRGSNQQNILDGFGAWWLWNSIYSSRIINNKNRFNLLLNYINSKLNKSNNFTRY
jgi:NADH dehydrogenase FAD-containing subunit